MKFQIEKIQESPASLLRRAGFVFQHERDGEMSFVRVLARSGYPRFHVYIQLAGTLLTGSIHLDQKKETYGRVTRHHGEYTDDGALKDEIVRIQTLVPDIHFFV